MRLYPSIHTAVILFTLVFAWAGESRAQGRASALKHVSPSGGYNNRVGDAVPGDTQAGPDTAAMCKDVKAVIKTASRNFEPLRGEPKQSKGTGSVWESKKSVQEFSNCAVYQAPSLGDYVMCLSTSPCASAKENFHLFSSALMSCMKNWSWQDGRVGYNEYERTVSATSEDGIRLTLELAYTRRSYSSTSALCDLMLSIELI